MADFGIDVKINPQPAQQGASKVEQILERIDRRAERMNRQLQQGLAAAGRAASQAAGETRALDTAIGNVNASAQRATTQMVGGLGEVREVQKVNNKLTGDFTKLITGAGIAMAAFGSIAAPVLNKVNALMEEGFHQIKRLGGVIQQGFATGEFGELEGPAAEQALIEAERDRRAGKQSTVRDIGDYVAAGAQLLGGVSGGLAAANQRPYASHTDEQLDQAMENSLKKSGAIEHLRKMGIDQNELLIMQHKSLAELQQAVIDKEAELTLAGIEEGKREDAIAKARARAAEQAAAEEKQRLDRIVSIVSGLDQQYGAEVKLKEVSEALMEGVRDFGLPLEYANELIAKQRDLLMFELHPAWSKMLDEIEGRTRQLSFDAEDGLKKVLALEDARRRAPLRDQFDIEDEENRQSARSARERTTVGGGAIAGLREIHEHISSTGTLIRDTMVGGMQEFEDSIVRAARTGKLEFGALFDYILDQLVRIGLRGGLQALVGDSIESYLKEKGAT